MGWTSLPNTPNAAHFNGNTHSGRLCAVLGHALGGWKRSESSNGSLLLKRRRPWIISSSNKIVAAALLGLRRVCRWRKAEVRAKDERLEILTACYPLEQRQGLTPIDCKMVQLHERALRILKRPDSV